jgi:hypothetical protein
MDNPNTAVRQPFRRRTHTLNTPSPPTALGTYFGLPYPQGGHGQGGHYLETSSPSTSFNPESVSRLDTQSPSNGLIPASSPVSLCLRQKYVCTVNGQV